VLAIIGIICVIVAGRLWGRIVGEAAKKQMARLREWWIETHSPWFELLRHFFFRFFDSELVSTPGQWKVVAGGALGIVASFSIIFIQAYYHKYGQLNALEDSGPYRMSVLADVLFLVTLAMSLTGLFTMLEWPSLFPGLRDYMALAALPLKLRDLFIARFTALVAMAAMFIIAVNLLPSAALPAVMHGDWGMDSRFHVLGIFAAGSLAAWFVFFSLVALQGVLLNVLPVRAFPRVSLGIQGTLLAVLLCGLAPVFSIPNLWRFMELRPAWALWLPPVWFLGVDQLLVGNHEPYAVRAALTGIAAGAAATVAAVCMYLWSYRRHKRRLLESPVVETVSGRLWPAALAGRMLPDPRELGVFAFVGKMLARSREHRLVLTVFAAIGVAIVFESFVSLALGRSFRGFSVETPALRQVVISAPLALSLFVLAGFRYLFRLPVELRANWVFRMAEPGNRQPMLAGVEKFLLYFGVLPVAAVMLPLEVGLLGPAVGLAASAVCLMISLVLMEILLIPFEKIPFTSSYLPGRRPLIETVVKYGFAVIAYVSLLSIVVSWCVITPAWTAVLLAVLTASWWKARRARIELQRIGKLEFEEAMEPAVQTLRIERD
jgi:hypothetical protein